jgi:hypothetical protein
VTDLRVVIRTRGDTAIRKVTADSGDIARAVHKHARGILGSSRVTIHLTPGTPTGEITNHGAAAGSFTLTTTPEPPTQAPRRDVLHGYGLDDIHDLARQVVRADRWYGADAQDRYDAAWHAIVEHLLTADEAPSRRDLFYAGTAGCDRAVRQTMQAHGYNTHQTGTGNRPNFERYWFLESAPTPSPEGGIVDRHALWQIWPKLTVRQQEALTALAATGDYQQAAAHLGIAQGTFHALLKQARRRFLTWWHEGEEPSRTWGTDRRVGSRAGTAPAVSKRRPATRAVVRRAGRPVHELVHGKASTYTNHGCRCTPCTQDATNQARERGRRNGATPRRRITVSQLTHIRTRRDSGETLTAIAADLGFSDSYLSRLLSGALKPALDPS